MIDRRAISIVAICAPILLGGCSSSEEDEKQSKLLDQSVTPLASCGIDDVRAAMRGILLVNWNDGAAICETARRSLGRLPSTGEFRYLTKTSGIIAVHGPKSTPDNAYQIMNVMEAARVGGGDRLKSGIEAVLKIYVGSGQRVTPRDLNIYLRSTRRSAAPMSNDDLFRAGAIVEELKKARGE